MALIGGLQGLALYALRESWPKGPASAPFHALLFCIVSAGAVIHFARSGAHARRLGALALVTGALFGAITYGVASQLPDPGAVFSGDESRLWSWRLAAWIALFVLGPFVQIFQESGRLRFPYPALYRHGWNNFFVAILGLLYVGALQLILLLWGRLFGLVGVDLFRAFFAEPLTEYVMNGAALGYGIAAARESERVIATLRGLTQTLLRALLPALAVVTLAFLATLPFTGLDQLFATKTAASVLAGWLVLQLVFFNAVYLDGSEAPPYGSWLRRVIELGVVSAPALAAIAAYALALRIGQHGLSPDRVHASVAVAVLGIYTVGYAAAVWRGGQPWLPNVRSVNVAMAWLVIGLAFALHTPILDPIRLSLSNQLARLASGAVRPDEFDYAFLRFELGRSGYEALQRLAQESMPSAVAERIQRALESKHRHVAEKPLETEPSSLDERFVWLAGASPWPPGFRHGMMGAGSWIHDSGCSELDPCEIRDVDLDRDGRSELIATQRDMQSILVLRQTGDEQWSVIGWAYNRMRLGTEQSQALRRAIRSGEVEAVEPQYRELRVGADVYRFSP